MSRLCDFCKAIYPAAGHFYAFIFVFQKNLYLQVCKFEKKYFRLDFFFANTIAYNSETGRSCSNCKVVGFVLSEISSRGAYVQK